MIIKNTKVKKLLKTTRKHAYRSVLVASAAVLLATFSFVLILKRVEAATVTPVTAIAFGDSIMDESAPIIGTYFHTHTATKTSFVESFPGIAICDMQATLESDMARVHPNLIILESMGNSATPCMQDSSGNQLPWGSQAWADKYRSDMDTFFATATGGGAKVLWLNKLPTINSSDTTLDTIALQEAGKYHGVSVSSLPRNTVTQSGTFVWKLKCTSAEVKAGYCGSDGLITVRDPDGVHLCPVMGFDFKTGCPTYSSGEKRWGQKVGYMATHVPAPILP